MITPLTLTSSHRDGVPTLHVTGEIDLGNVDAFTTALGDALTHADPHTTITVDLAAVTYLDSAAINTLFDNADRIQITANPLLMAVLTVSGLTDLITVTPTRASHECRRRRGTHLEMAGLLPRGQDAEPWLRHLLTR